MRTWGSPVSQKHYAERDQNCPLLFTNAGMAREIRYSRSQNDPVLWSFSHTLNFNCYLYSKGNPPVNGKFCPSVNFGSNAW